MMTPLLARQTLYLLITAIEEDLREAISQSLTGTRDTRDILSPELHARCVERFTRDEDVPTAQPSLPELLHYTDLGDIPALLGRNRADLPGSIQPHLKLVTETLQILLPIRNRVMHTRPLHVGDLASAFDAAHRLASIGLDWSRLTQARTRIESDPASLSTVSIEHLDSTDGQRPHNLPFPDYDETGFVGREQHVGNVVRLCTQSAYPVITIIGEGGVGKTAVALEAAYRLLDTEPMPYDYIVWVSSKTALLTATELRQIESAITESAGLFRRVAVELANAPDADSVSEVLSYMREFKILLVIDNLENIIDNRIRDFLAQLPRESRVLITSRIGIGEFEYRVNLPPFSDKEALDLTRAMASARGVQGLVAMPNPKLAEYCHQLKNNPGFIKWFIMAVQAGQRPEEVLQHTDLFLDYCMSNVYEYLTTSDRRALDGLVAVGSPMTQAEISFISDLQPDGIASIVQRLLLTSMVNVCRAPRGASFETTYEVTPLARAYLARQHPIATADFQAFGKRKRQLLASVEAHSASMQSDLYDVNHIAIKTRNDVVVSRHLREGLRFCRERAHEHARESIERAKQLDPGFFEVYRVDAWVEGMANNLAGALSSYEAAIGMEPNWAPLRYWYAGFLLRSIDDTEGAYRELRKAKELDPHSVEIDLEVARVAMYLRKWDDCDASLASISGAERRTDRTMKICFDLRIQYHTRRAEWLMEHDDLIAAIDALEQVRPSFEACPIHLRDIRMVRRVEKALATVYGCQDRLESIQRDEALVARVEKVAAWAEDLVKCTASPAPGEDAVAVVRQRPLNGSYALARLDLTGRSVPFKKESMQDEGEWEKIKVGSRVTLRIALLGNGKFVGEDVRASAAEPVQVSGARVQQRDGQVRRILRSEGYGFIEDERGDSVFFHQSELRGREAWDYVETGDRVVFRPGIDDRGRRVARDVRVVI